MIKKYIVRTIKIKKTFIINLFFIFAHSHLSINAGCVHSVPVKKIKKS